jgi:predicted membrane chloride channel (bestrophin family)
MWCRKLVDTPFPFPWAQAINICLLMFTVGAPIVLVAHTTSIWSAVFVTFACVHTHVMLNEVRPALRS